VTFSRIAAEAAVVLRVVPGTPTTVDHVVITGLESTRDVVVRRELAVKEGEPLALDRVLESQRRLGALGLFDRVTITEMDPDSPQRRSVVVRAEEAPLTSVSYGIGYAEQDYLRGSVEVTRRNLFGMDRRLSASRGRASAGSGCSAPSASRTCSGASRSSSSPPSARRGAARPSATCARA
jgi:outer membrane protein assembly factor BamA